jgi:hypothetical protein
MIKTDLKKLYNTDYSQWLEETMKQLNERQFNNLDYEHLIEELEALGRNEKSTVESLVIRIIQHLLLYQYWQEEREYNSRHWHSEIVAFRTQLELRMTKNLQNHLSDRLDYLYSKARKIAQLKSDLKLPESNPYLLSQILDEDWLPTQQ